jgi:hypothetical protein
VNYINPINCFFILVYSPKLLIFGFLINQIINLNYSRIFGNIINTCRIKLLNRVNNITPINQGVLFILIFNNKRVL